MTEKMRQVSPHRDGLENGRFLHGEELGELARMLQAHTPLCQLSDMQVRAALELMQQRGWRISRP